MRCRLFSAIAPKARRPVRDKLNISRGAPAEEFAND